MAYHSDREDQVDQATGVLTEHYLEAMEVTESNVRYAIRQAIWDQLVYATAVGFDSGELIEEIRVLCERAVPREETN
jgi:hypothetical protein